MASRGGQIGNTNGSKGKPWADAIRYALLNYESKELKIKRGQALKAIARKVVEAALSGDDDAIDEIANRMDGKPVQAIEGTGENGAITVTVNKFADNTPSK
jgi:hypothetical protein